MFRLKFSNACHLSSRERSRDWRNFLEKFIGSGKLRTRPIAACGGPTTRSKIGKAFYGALCSAFLGTSVPLPGDSRVSVALRAAQAGDRQAATELLPLVYAELHQLARARMARQPPGQTLTPTALVHEAYLRIAGKNDLTFEGRQHFFFAAARAMRDILVEQDPPQRGGKAWGRAATRRAGRGVRRPGTPVRRGARGSRGLG